MNENNIKICQTRLNKGIYLFIYSFITPVSELRVYANTSYLRKDAVILLIHLVLENFSTTETSGQKVL